MNKSNELPEPWLRGTLVDVDAVKRQVLHALELTGEDVRRWCGELTDAEMNARPFGIAPVGFHLRHIARSLDRLLTYAAGRQLDLAQLAALKAELTPDVIAADVLEELRSAMADAKRRVLAIAEDSYQELRGVGRAMLPSTVGGLLVHCAEHTQRHTGQMVTTAKIVLAMRDRSGGPRVTARSA